MQDLITDLIDSLGYAGIALLMLAETILIFLPSEIIMPFAGFAAADGKFSLVGVIIAGTVGSTAGATLLYGLARFIPDETVHRLIDRYGKLAGISRRDYDRADKWFDRHDLPAVFFGRLIPGVRSAISVPAGLAHMPFPRFFTATLTGSAIWTAVLATAGYQLGEQYETVERFIAPISKAVLAALVASAIIFLIRRRRRK